VILCIDEFGGRFVDNSCCLGSVMVTASDLIYAFIYTGLSGVNLMLRVNLMLGLNDACHVVVAG